MSTKKPKLKLEVGGLYVTASGQYLYCESKKGRTYYMLDCVGVLHGYYPSGVHSLFPEKCTKRHITHRYVLDVEAVKREGTARHDGMLTDPLFTVGEDGFVRVNLEELNAPERVAERRRAAVYVKSFGHTYPLKQTLVAVDYYKMLNIPRCA